ncbi:hypothetical protein [Mucilaginibacter koreensis]
MSSSFPRRIAAVLGPALIIVTSSEIVNLKIWLDVHPTLVYLNGLLFVIGGLIIVTNHNRWEMNRGVLITISGWMLLLAGTFRMFFPTSAQLGPGLMTYIIISLLGLLGIAISFIAIKK